MIAFHHVRSVYVNTNGSCVSKSSLSGSLSGLLTDASNKITATFKLCSTTDIDRMSEMSPEDVTYRFICQEYIPTSTAIVMKEIIWICTASWRSVLCLRSLARIASTNSHCCINRGHCLAMRMKRHTPKAVVEKNATPTEMTHHIEVFVIFFGL